MKYTISASNPHQRYVHISLAVTRNKSKTIICQLPTWRPGRYELGNFAKNVRSFFVTDTKGNPLSYKKINKDRWEIEAAGNDSIQISYDYYAIDLNAGSTYLDEKQLYMNPVNCCMYIDGRIGESCTVELQLPVDYKVATAMKEVKKHTFEVKDFHELVDSPFIASNTLQSKIVSTAGIEFYLWFQGECKPDWQKLEKDFVAFINEQIAMMKEIPVKEYHFLFQIVPYKMYHGVEHVNSTVIALGPSFQLMKKELYDELLGVSSHELFHVWNIKTIRPQEMMPYDYTKENYFRTGYVAEGITTYYGDLFLLRSGVFSHDDYFKTFNTQLQKHFDNYGRFNYSVADSSYDTWLDGYVPGTPGRKVSIYTEGCLLAFMTDVFIRRSTGNTKSLDDVMTALYQNFAKKGTGYSEQDYLDLVEKIAGKSFQSYVTKYISGKENYEPQLQADLAYLGCKLSRRQSPRYFESAWGIKVIEEPNSIKIGAIAPGSPADEARLMTEDKIMAINNIELSNNLNEWGEYFDSETVILTVSNRNTIRQVKLKIGNSEYYPLYFVERLEKVNEDHREAFTTWSKQTL